MRKILLTIGALFLACLFVQAALAEPKHNDKFAQSVVDELKVDRTVLSLFHDTRESEVRYLESENAYRYAMDDLEDYMNGDPSITEERVRNDALEVWMDLAPYRALLDGTRR
jgi:hypothetical protein